MKTIISILLLFFSTLIFSQVESSTKSKGVVKPKYFQDFLNFASGSEALTRVDIFIQVPYSEVQFVFTSDTQYTASYQISISIFDEDREKLIMEKTWNEKVEAKDFPQTVSKNNFNLSLRSFNLEPGKYVIRTSVEDRESQKDYFSENEFEVREFSLKTDISDIMLIAKQSVQEGSSKILPNVSRNITAQKEGIRFFYEIYSSKPEKVSIEYSIMDDNKKVLKNETEERDIDSGRVQVFHTLKDSNLSMGRYTLNIKMMNSDKDVIASAQKFFNSRWAGVPSAIQDLDKAISQLVYIATTEELDLIKETDSREGKIEKYMAFWKKKDPVPTTEENEIFDEYYRRIEYSNENFSHYSEGWKTDRGMVFIILGPPSNVDRHPFDYDAKPYEIWEYYDLNRNFIFVDETGFGDYRLITPLYGDNYRFR